MAPKRKKKNSTAMRRLLHELKDLQKNYTPTSQFFAAPLEDNLFEWHFTLRGSSDSPFAGGLYHGVLYLPSRYPMEAPDFVFLTPTGRFEVGKKICLSISSYHPESWSPSWNISTMLHALIAFMESPANNAIGAIDSSVANRQALAKASVDFKCNKCGVPNKVLLPPLPSKKKDEELEDCEEAKDKAGAPPPIEAATDAHEAPVVAPETPVAPLEIQDVEGQETETQEELEIQEVKEAESLPIVPAPMEKKEERESAPPSPEATILLLPEVEEEKVEVAHESVEIPEEVVEAEAVFFAGPPPVVAEDTDAAGAPGGGNSSGDTPGTPVNLPTKEEAGKMGNEDRQGDGNSLGIASPLPPPFSSPAGKKRLRPQQIPEVDNTAGPVPVEDAEEIPMTPVNKGDAGPFGGVTPADVAAAFGEVGAGEPNTDEVTEDTTATKPKKPLGPVPPRRRYAGADVYSWGIVASLGLLGAFFVSKALRS